MVMTRPKGENEAKYAAAGITTDHECFTIEEGRDTNQLWHENSIGKVASARETLMH